MGFLGFWALIFAFGVGVGRGVEKLSFVWVERRDLGVFKDLTVFPWREFILLEDRVARGRLPVGIGVGI